ncbi:MAG: hypothetical protein Rubg2KO_02120 [Rubricoccaceae bacterium]
MLRRSVLLAALVCGPVLAQTVALEVAVDCPGRVPGCDRDFFQIETPFVRFVRDRQDADVYALALADRTGGGGSEVTVYLTGRRAFTGYRDTLRVQTRIDATNDDERRALLGRLHLGLVGFASQTDLADHLSVVYTPPARPPDAEVAEEATVRDPWNGWTFRLSGRGSFSAESQVRGINLSESIDARRVTDDWKLRLRTGGSYRESRFTYDPDGDGPRDDTTRVTTISSLWAGGHAIRSLSPHMSAGLGAGASRQSFRNYDLRLRAGPAVEYNLYRYDEATQRQLVVLYGIGVELAAYTDTTIYGKLDEVLPQHQASLSAAFTQPWGQTDLQVSASQHLSVASSYNIGVSGDMSLRLTRGLNLTLSASAELIRDQRYLLAGSASAEEVLTRQRALATGYEYSGSVGLSYTFGSAFRPVVNPRFDNGLPF